MSNIRVTVEIEIESDDYSADDQELVKCSLEGLLFEALTSTDAYGSLYMSGFETILETTILDVKIT